jgi:small subunit ribosomal protein S16
MQIRKVFKTPEEFGPLKMRMQRMGRSNFPFYQIVVAQSRMRRNGRYNDVVGYYTPHPTDMGNKHINLHFDKCKQWLAVGATPSSMVSKLLSKAGLWPSLPRRYSILEYETYRKKLEESFK